MRLIPRKPLRMKDCPNEQSELLPYLFKDEQISYRFSCNRFKKELV